MRIVNYDERMAAIIAADNERMIARLEREAALFASGAQVIDPYHKDRQITGEPSEKNRTYRASDDCWKRGLRSRTVGTATDDGNQTVKVIHPDGSTEIRSASSFRKENLHKKQRTHARTVARDTRPEVLKFNVGNIGNVE